MKLSEIKTLAENVDLNFESDARDLAEQTLKLANLIQEWRLLWGQVEGKETKRASEALIMLEALEIEID